MAPRSTIDELREAIRRIEQDGQCADAALSGCGLPARDDPGDADDAGLPPVAAKDPADDEQARAFAKISRIVSLAEKSSRQIRERLARDGFEHRAIEDALARAQSCGMVDDRRYAEWLVRSRLRQGRGISGIERELAEDGYSLEDLPGWPEEFGYGDDSEMERALAFLDAHPPRAKNLRGSAYRKLVTKGFSPSCASSASRTWCEQREEREGC